MPDSCCVPNCTNRRKTGEEGGFYKIPNKKHPVLRERWLTAIGRIEWSEELIKNAKVCHLHFVSGKKSKDSSHPDWVPSVFERCGKRVSEKRKLEKQDRHSRLTKQRKLTSELVAESESDDDFEPPEDQGPSMSELCQKVQELEEKVKCLEKDLNNEVDEKQNISNKYTGLNSEYANRLNEIHGPRNKNKTLSLNKFCYKSLKQSPEMFYFYTGLNKGRFNWVVNIVKHKIKPATKLLTQKDHVLVVLMKLKLGLLNRDIAYRFKVRPPVISRIYLQLLPLLAKSLLFTLIWPEKQALRKNLPKCFRCYKSCCCIIDCTEIFIQRPLNLNARAQTWSNYKNTNTIKYLIACSPSGSVSFLSRGWGGRVSDKEITIKSGFLDLVENGDMVLADRGFLIEQELATRGAFLKIPEFTRGKDQMSAADVDRSRQIANVRIHIERVIGRLRKFMILNTTIPITQVDLMDKVMVVVCALVNISKGIV